jgi:hypothetical protein
MTLGSIQLVTEMSARNLLGGKGRPALKADSLASICEPIVVSQRYGLPRPVTLRKLPSRSPMPDTFLEFLQSPSGITLVVVNGIYIPVPLCRSVMACYEMDGQGLTSAASLDFYFGSVWRVV